MSLHVTRYDYMLYCTTRSPNECIEKPSGVGCLSWWLYDRLQSALVARLPVRERFLHEIYLVSRQNVKSDEVIQANRWCQ